jgi:hypothetical protein
MEELTNKELIYIIIAIIVVGYVLLEVFFWPTCLKEAKTKGQSNLHKKSCGWTYINSGGYYATSCNNKVQGKYLYCPICGGPVSYRRTFI